MDAATLNLPAVAGTSVAQGSYLSAATAREPVAVLGAGTARLLGSDQIRPRVRIWLSNGSFGGLWFAVTGILSPDAYAPELDSAVLVGFPAAVDHLLGAQANPETRPRSPSPSRSDSPGSADPRLRGC